MAESLPDALGPLGLHYPGPTVAILGTSMMQENTLPAWLGTAAAAAVHAGLRSSPRHHPEASAAGRPCRGDPRLAGQQRLFGAGWNGPEPVGSGAGAKYYQGSRG